MSSSLAVVVVALELKAAPEHDASSAVAYHRVREWLRSVWL